MMIYLFLDCHRFTADNVPYLGTVTLSLQAKAYKYSITISLSGCDQEGFTNKYLSTMGLVKIMYPINNVHTMGRLTISIKMQMSSYKTVYV